MGSLDEYGRFFDSNHVYKGNVDELGRFFTENGEWIGDGSDSYLKHSASVDETEKTDDDESDVSMSSNSVVNEAPAYSKIMYLNRGCFIKWMIIFVVLAVLGIAAMGIIGLALAYALTSCVYGGSISGISLLDASADAMESMGGSLFTGIAGVLKLTFAFCMGIVTFPIHLVKAIVAIIQGEI